MFVNIKFIKFNQIYNEVLVKQKWLVQFKSVETKENWFLLHMCVRNIENQETKPWFADYRH